MFFPNASDGKAFPAQLKITELKKQYLYLRV